MLIQSVVLVALPTRAIAGKDRQLQQALAQQERRDAEQQLIDLYTPQIKQMFTEYSRAVPVGASNEDTLRSINSFIANTGSEYSGHLDRIFSTDTNYTHGRTTLTAHEQRDVFFSTLGQYVGQHINLSRLTNTSLAANPSYRDSAEQRSNSYNEKQVIHALRFLSIVTMEASIRENTKRKNFTKPYLSEPEALTFSLKITLAGVLTGVPITYAMSAILHSPTDVLPMILSGLATFGYGYGWYYQQNVKTIYPYSRATRAIVQGLFNGLGITDKKLQKQFVHVLQNQNIEPLRAALCEGALAPKRSAPRARVETLAATAEAPQQYEVDHAEAPSAQRARQTEL